MKNKKNKLLTLTALSMMPLMGFVALACQKGVEPDKPKPDPDNKNNDVNNNNENPTPNNNGTNNGSTTAESNFDFSKTSSNFDENFSLWNFTNPSSYKSKTAEEFVNGFSEYSITATKDKNVKLVISNAQLSSNPNEVEVTVALESNPSINKKYKLSGFKTKEYNPFDTSNEDSSEAEAINYIKASISEKFEKDIEKYKPRLENIRKQVPYNSDLTESEIVEYNRKAEALGLPSYEQARLLGQVLPKTNNGGLTMPEFPNPQFLNWYDDLGLTKDQSHKNHGLPRTITNEQYGKMGLQTYNLTINSTVFLYHNEAQKNKLEQALKYQEDWTEMIDKIEDSSVKVKLKEEYDKHNPSKQHNYELGIIHKIQKATIQELIKQEYKKLGGTDTLDKRYDGHGDFEYVLVNYNDQQQSLLFRADNEVVWEKMWKPHLINEQNKIISKIEQQGFEQDVVNRAKEVIKKSNELWRLSNMVRSDNVTAGTAFIIDFEKPKVAGQRPKKWYFATNQHVIEDAFPNSFKSLGLTFLKQKSIGKNLKTTVVDNDNFDNIGIEAEAVSLIWEGKDYLKKDPKDFVPGVDEKIKEYIDIAIFEIDFDKLKNLTESEKNSMIDRFSHGYANNPEDQIKIINYDYLNNYEKINFPKVRDSKDTKEYDTLYALGYPLTNSLKSHNFMDYELDQYENEKDLAASTYTYSLWTNAKSSWYKFDYGGMTDTQKEQLNKGSGLGYNLSYRTFKNKHGIVDSFLSSNRFGKDLYKDENGNKFYNMSLAYIVDRYTPGGGASGSSVRNQNNELVGLFHISNYFAKAGLTEAVRSNGYDYNGLFGEYNLPQYDIIYGGGKDQKTSYREALKEKYGDSYQTNLFDNITEIPENHKFKNKQAE